MSYFNNLLIAITMVVEHCILVSYIVHVVEILFGSRFSWSELWRSTWLNACCRFS
jgi:hypothetical protein